jgi:hypothetical protein
VAVELADAKVPGSVAQRQATLGGPAAPNRLTRRERSPFLPHVMRAPELSAAAA